ncbi:MAG: hypothetical protein ACTS4U_01020 [Candidatus Hodgkinia cicadicola]
MISLFETNFGGRVNGKSVAKPPEEVLKLLSFEGELSPPAGVLACKRGEGDAKLSLSSLALSGRDLVKTCVMAEEVSLTAECGVCFNVRRPLRFCVGASWNAISAERNAFCATKVNRMSLTNRGNVLWGAQRSAKWLSLKSEVWNQNPPVAFERLIAQTLGAT